MTKRFFYTDALAAAWQAKHFGMEFFNSEEEPLNRACWKWGEDVRYEDFFYANPSGIIERAKTERFYIYPGSLSLLEPQVGDLINTGGDDFLTVVVDGIYCARDEPYINLKDSRDCRIIQRNGVAFHYPESEDANG